METFYLYTMAPLKKKSREFITCSDSNDFKLVKTFINNIYIRFVLLLFEIIRKFY